MNYTQEELERARAYARMRLEATGLMTSAIDTILEECVDTLVDFILGGATEQEIDDAIDSLIDSLLEWIDNIAVSEHDDRRDALLLWLHGTWNEGGLESIVRERSHTFFDEVATLCDVGLLLGLGKTDIVSSIKANMRDPWKNPLIAELKDRASRGLASLPADLDLEERHYGQGIPISSLTGLEGLGASAVADAWTWWQHASEKDNGAVGYHVLRGSSYDCPECDSHTGIFFPIDDEEHLPQYHAHCMCFVVYSYVDRL